MKNRQKEIILFMADQQKAGKSKNLKEDIILIKRLARNDFRTRYAGSYLGIFWAFVQPVVTIFLYWFVFSKLTAGRVREVPFILWLIAGLVPWFYFSDCLNGGCASLLEYSYLVKKVVFKIHILPVVKLVSALYVHLFFVLVTVILYTAMGHFPGITLIELPYYSLCIFCLVLSVSYLTSAVAVLFRDLTQIIAIILQVGVWMTPIMWNFDDIGLAPGLRVVFMLNPMYYIVEGFRGALIDGKWFWEEPVMTAYFWILTLLIFLLGRSVFARLRVHFADVL